MPLTERIIEFVLDEGKWLSASMILSVAAIVVFVGRHRREGPLHREQILAGMNLFYGCMIGMMASGHLLAVTVKVSQATLRGSWWVLYPLGLVLAVPALWLIVLAGGHQRNAEWRKRTTSALNAWLAIWLLALGLHNLPLALPAGLTLAYQFHTRRVVGWTIVSITVVGYLGLFVGSLIFLASGQSFEQFSGKE